MRHQAVLLLGPTGVGKSPLGDLLEEVGFEGRRCHHFDFGVHLRAAGACELRPGGLTDGEVAVVRRVLETGALLEDDEFAIAAKLLGDFLARRQVAIADLLVLNGLPRHVGQAEAIAHLLDVVLVFHLHADAEVLAERIRLDTGGDRAGRTDNHAEAVARRLATFEARTRPLLDLFGPIVRHVEVVTRTTPADVLRALSRE